MRWSLPVTSTVDASAGEAVRALSSSARGSSLLIASAPATQEDGPALRRQAVAAQRDDHARAARAGEHPAAAAVQPDPYGRVGPRIRVEERDPGRPQQPPAPVAQRQPPV